MKRIISLILAAVTIVFSAGCSFVRTVNEDVADTFVTVKIPFPDTIKENDSWRTYARYVDTGKAVTLSVYYDGCVYATVPIENKDKKLEAFIPKAVEFTDIGENSAYFDIEWLSSTGVITGNENGEAEPLKSLKRKDAVSMLIRFLGITSSGDKENPFSDISENDEFYADACEAKRRGIVEVSEKEFLPNEKVSREDFMIMTRNALKHAGLSCPAAGVINLLDGEEISEQGKNAYEYIGAACVYDYEENPENFEEPYEYAHAKSDATVIFAARLLNNIKGVCQVYPSDTAVKFGFDKEMPIIDGSTSTHPFTRAVYQNLFYNGLSHEMFPRKHSKSHASYERLINGEVDMIFASVYPASDILQLAEQKGVELELIPIAYDAMIFFTNADNPQTGLTQAQITDIYVNNAYDNWSELGGCDAKLYPYCRNNDSGSHAQMERHFLNGAQIHPEVQKETSYTMSNVLTDVMAAQTENPKGYGLGYSIFYYFNNMDMIYDTKTYLKLLEVDCVMPTDETIADGEYPLSNNTYIVLRADTPKDSAARKLAEFMLTDEGQDCVEAAGFGRLK